jgi:hypoxanthine phosphoribosyltransferase
MPVIRDQSIEVLYSAEKIAQRNEEIALSVANASYRDLLVVAILKGSFIFAADLIRAMHQVGLSPEMEFISVSSYGAGTQSGELKLLRDIETDVAGRDVLLIDDILESGKTLAFTRDLLLSRGANAVLLAVLLDKPFRRQIDIKADHVGFECTDVFVVGYGMDKAHAFRELPFVGKITGNN